MLRARSSHCLAVLTTLLVSTALHAAPGDFAQGDMNMDGRLDLRDIEAFAIAMVEPGTWVAQYATPGDAAPVDTMTALGDFDGDGRVTIEDRIGFLRIIAQAVDVAGPRETPNGSTTSARRDSSGGRTSPGVIDLDIDSNNDATNGYAARSSAEDAIENDPNYSGRVVRVGDSAAPLALEIAPATGVPPLTSVLDYRFYYPDSVRLWAEPAKSTRIYSATTTLTQRVWVRGDMNASGTLNFADIDPWLTVLYGTYDPNQYLANYQDMHARVIDMADFNHDRAVTFADINLLTAALGTTTYVSVYAFAEGVTPDQSLGATQITAKADTDDDSDIDTNDATPDDVRAMVRQREPGGAPAWGAGVPVSQFSTVNLDGGNVLTSLALTGFAPRGPAVGFVLYHNSTIPAGGTDHGAWGFDLGDGWSVSYGRHVVGTPCGDDVALVTDDGTVLHFARYSDCEYNPPAGYYGRLSWDYYYEVWTLVSPDLSVQTFNEDGYLTSVTDGNGNTLNVIRNDPNDPNCPSCISAIASAAEVRSDVTAHRITYSFDPNTHQLVSVTDPVNRVWGFAYEHEDPNDPNTPYRLTTITYPHDAYVPESDVQFCYDESNRVRFIKSRDARPSDDNAKWWELQYDGAGRLAAAYDCGPTPVDPNSVSDPNNYHVSLTYAATADTDGWKTTLTDRRGNPWGVWFDAVGNVRKTQEPAEDPNYAGPVTTQTVDAAHNTASVTNALGKTWTYTYDSYGNALTATSPLTGQTWRWTWESPLLSSPYYPFVRRLIEVDDPNTQASNDPNHFTLKLAYELSGFPLLPTKLTEPATEDHAASDTTITYYTNAADPNEPLGQVKEITDANGVKHAHEWDKWGYLAKLSEGLLSGGGRTSIAPVVFQPENNDIGQPYSPGPEQTDQTYWQSDNTQGYDANGNPQPGLSDCSYTIAMKSDGGLRRLGEAPAGYLCDANAFFTQGSAITRDVVGRPLSMYVQMNVEHPQSAQKYNLRDMDMEYDDMGRPTFVRKGFAFVPLGNDPKWKVDRYFQVPAGGYDPDGRVLALTGPDGAATYSVYNRAGRPALVERSDGLGVVYHYDDAGRLNLTENQLYATTKSQEVRTYDDADRLLTIEHRDASNNPLLTIGYGWNLNNTVSARTEVDYTVVPYETAVVYFWYDARQRVTREVRIVNSTTTVYDLSYDYDKLGNRLFKHDVIADQRTDYVYDTDPNNCDPNYVTNNNRLLAYKLYDVSDPNQDVLLRTVKYVFWSSGNVSDILLKDEWTGEGTAPLAYQTTFHLGLYYSADGSLVQADWGRKIGEQNYGELARRYFYYDSPTELFATETYLYDQDYRPTRATCSAAALEFTDYAGGQPYGEYTLHAPEPVSSCDEYTAYTLEDTRHLPAAGTQGVQQLTWTGEPNAPTYSVAQTRFLHGDMIRSTMLTTDPNASDPNLIPQSRITYTAFGEPIVCSASDACDNGPLFGGCQDWAIGGDLPGAPDDPNCAAFGLPPLPRYGYAGGFGYQSGRTKTHYAIRYGAVAGSDPNLPGADAPYSDLLTLKGANPALPAISLQHLGHRWYDPGLGRFVQRDPVGLAGGRNPYLYGGDNPISMVDPLGLWWNPANGFVGDPVTTGPLWARIYLNYTGGMSSWLDNPRKVANAQAALAVPAGIVVACYAPWAGSLGVAWGIFRGFGGSTGTDIDRSLDGVVMGEGATTVLLKSPIIIRVIVKVGPFALPLGGIGGDRRDCWY